MSSFEINQILHSLTQPGIKTQQEVDFCRKVVPLLDRLVSLDTVFLTTMDVEAKRHHMSWGVYFVGNQIPIMDFGSFPQSEHNARLVAEILNTVRIIKRTTI